MLVDPSSRLPIGNHLLTVLSNDRLLRWPGSRQGKAHGPPTKHFSSTPVTVGWVGHQSDSSEQLGAESLILAGLAPEYGPLHPALLSFPVEHGSTSMASLPTSRCSSRRSPTKGA